MLLVLILAIDMQQLQREHHQRGKMRRMPITGRKRERKNIRRRGARRPDSNAGREPKGAIALPLFPVMAILVKLADIAVIWPET